jgi:hypothetical protein
MWRRFKAALLASRVPVSHGGVVGQAWRAHGPRQALLAKALAGIHVHPLDEAAGRRAGELLALSKQTDVIDAALVLLAEDGDHVVTSDPGDLEPLAQASGRHVELIRT